MRPPLLRLLLACAVLATLLGGLPADALAASAGQWERAPGGLTIIYADEQEVQTYIAPPEPVAELRAQAATITVEYVGFPPEAQAAFQYAVEIWQSLLDAPIPIHIRASWETLPRGVLGAAGPTDVYRERATDTWYPVALAQQRMNRDPQPGAADIEAQFNSSGVPWYFGTGQAPSGQYNLATVVLHELGHGLGFTDSFNVVSGQGSWGFQGYPLIYDRFVVDGNGVGLLDEATYPNPSTALAAGLQSRQLTFNGPQTLAANGGQPARLYAPNPYQSGSSIAHLDEATYPAGNPNSLMTPRGARGESNYNPGPITLGILADLGWTLSGAAPPPPPVTPTDGTSRCFPETGKCVSGRFLTYWNTHGGLPINGLPLTDPRFEILEDGQRYEVQYFERVRMEYHPEFAAPNDVLLGQFGRLIHPADPPVARVAGQQYFPETGHNVPADFFAFWGANGGLSQFGYPLSEVFREKLEDGKTYEVQYFERARFERHPENRPPNNIQLGQFGRRILTGGRGASILPPAAMIGGPRATPAPCAAVLPASGGRRESAGA